MWVDSWFQCEMKMEMQGLSVQRIGDGLRSY